MFFRIKKSGKYQYLQIVENHRDGNKTCQHVLVTIGRLDKLRAEGTIERLVSSLATYSDKALIVLAAYKNSIAKESKKIGPPLIFERLWKDLHIGEILHCLSARRRFSFPVERAVFLTVLHRLFASGSDRYCDTWRTDYAIDGVDVLSLHHLYRAMEFLGEIDDQQESTTFSPRCTKDIIEEKLFNENRDLFSGLEIVFFDTTSIYFEGEGGETLGEYGYSKDHRPDRKQMIVGVVLDLNGTPISCEMWPGNTADVTTLLPVIERLRKRFKIEQCCIVADRGMISTETVAYLDEHAIPYILGSRMRRMKEIKEAVLSEGGYQEVYPEGTSSKDPSPLKVKDVYSNNRRYIVCINEKQARKDAADRQAIIESLQKKVKENPKSLISNKGYRKYLTINGDTIHLHREKINEEQRYDGKWVLTTNTAFTAEKAALRYKDLWQVEHVFRDMKSILETRPIYHQRDETIRGHVFCSFLALLLRKELDRRLEVMKFDFEWANIKKDLDSLDDSIIEEKGKKLLVRSECRGTCGKVFQAVGVALPPTIRELM